MIAIQQLSYRFNSSKNKPAALDEVSLDVKTGEIFGLLGPNGGGKTTLFRLLTTMLTVQAGTILIDGVNVAEKPAQARKKFGVVFQSPSLDKKLTLMENLLHQGRLYGLHGESLRQKAASLLKKLSLFDRANDIVETLSGGMQRRGEIAKGMLHNPALLIMDEPSTGLDPNARKEMWDLLGEFKKQGVTVFITTHLMEEGEKCDRLAILNKGKLVVTGTPNELKSKIGGDVVILQSNQPETLKTNIQTKLGLEAQAMNGSIRVEIKDGHKFIPILIETFPGMIEAASVGKPTLEDVFVHETGYVFQSQGVEVE